MRVLLLTPPFTQINTPYPATAFLKRYLTNNGYAVKQVDLGIDLLLSIYSQSGLKQVFNTAKLSGAFQKKSNKRIWHQVDQYIRVVEPVIRFLQTRETSLAYTICKNDFLPKGERFNQPLDLDWIFGIQGVIDKACYFSTLFLEDLADFIKKELAPEFGFSRYAEQLALSATEFDPLYHKLHTKETLLDSFLESLLISQLQSFKPDVIGMTIPFPGCLYGALQCGKIIRKFNSSLKIVLGGGYISTELRELKDSRIFEFTDFLVLDQGELPFLRILEFLSEKKIPDTLSNTYLLQDQQVVFLKGTENEAPFSESGYPDYSDLELNKYLSIIEIPNAMHRLWNDGKWNKIMVARGCYWSKCAFCDVTLDYIKNYTTISAVTIVDRMEQIIAQTGQTGFHFVDEAAPPKILKDIALELLKRNLQVNWWTNIRFEKNFNPDLCLLLAKSGCIAVSGGLETVSDRLLHLMNKGITISQAVKVLQNFTQAGILVHAYLMYGFPTQTSQETIDSLEIVRQLYQNKLLHSCYWHRFSLTAHSKIALDPEVYQIRITGPPKGSFAWNDLAHEDKSGCQHHQFASGLEKAVYNYMFEIGIDFEAAYWFDFRTPLPTVSPEFVSVLMTSNLPSKTSSQDKRLIWLGSQPELTLGKKTGKKKNPSGFKLHFYHNNQVIKLNVNQADGNWLCQILPQLAVRSNLSLTIGQVSDDYESKTNRSFQDLIKSEFWQSLNKIGLLTV